MVQGTASSVGKSLLVTALCRYFHRAGVRVAPFKAQNMALNAAVTPDGLEIGRAQAVQAEAAGLPAAVEMNPVLLKPEGDRRSQVVVMGRPVASMSARDYDAHKPALRRIIADCLTRLRRSHELVVIEGAGSPAEINLKSRDLVNMYVAGIADAPVLLVGDIDRGGVFAAFVGTLELLEAEERARIAGFVVNKFRGDPGLLTPGLDFLHRRTGRPVLGVLPYLAELRLPDEDSLSLDQRRVRGRPGAGALDIAVVRLPRIANSDDVEPLEHEPGVTVRFVDRPEQLVGADLLILPGSKQTVTDLAWLQRSGIARVIAERAATGAPVLGLCGGCQMLGERIDDPDQVESSERSTAGLGLLPLHTRFQPSKVTAQVLARSAAACFLTDQLSYDQRISGYELHMGQVEPTGATARPFQLLARNGDRIDLLDGAIGAGGAVVGTMIHGLFDNPAVRESLLAALRTRRGLAPPEPATSPETSAGGSPPSRQATYDRLAASVADVLDLDLLWRLSRLERR
jgi:adenosylcobyric acid synthase